METERANPIHIKFLKIFLAILIISLSIAGVFIYARLNNKNEVSDEETYEFCKLYNSNYYCYMNSLMQVLYHLDDFRTLILNANSPKHSLYDEMNQIFSKIKNDHYADLTEHYEKIISMINAKFTSSQFQINCTGCSIEAFYYLMSSLIDESSNIKLDNLPTNFELIKDTDIAKMFFLNRMPAHIPTCIYPYMAILNRIDASNIEKTVNDAFVGDRKYLSEPLPSTLTIQNYNCKDDVTYNYATLQEFITVAGIRYKFKGYLHLTPMSTKSKKIPHYTACLQKEECWYILNDASPVKKIDPKFNQELPGVTAIFYARVDLN